MITIHADKVIIEESRPRIRDVDNGDGTISRSLEISREADAPTLQILAWRKDQDNLDSRRFKYELLVTIGGDTMPVPITREQRDWFQLRDIPEGS